MVLKAMESEPERRYPSASEMRSDVDAVRTVVGSQPVEASLMPASEQLREVPKPGRTKPLAVLVVVLLAAAILAGVVLKFFGAPEESMTKSGSDVAFKPDLATKERPFKNCLGMRFVPVPILGGPSVGKHILFSIWETRVRDYKAFMKTQPDREWLATKFSQELDHPAVRMTWQDAADFCAWLTQEDRKGGLLTDDEFYRLPSDYEWSCAVGIGDVEDPLRTPGEKYEDQKRLFAWGNFWPPPPGFGNFGGEELQRDPWRGRPFPDNIDPWLSGYEDAFSRTAPVGTFGANMFGLFDTSGNVYEWVDSFKTNAGLERTARGSAWNDFAMGRLRLTYRVFNDPNITFDTKGFRVVLERGAQGQEQLVPRTETIAGQVYLCWRGQEVEFQ
ncbi:MAG: SUMF1/EgtB/PvdO family nonheme iron enzyme, partial [Myxococcota bacterium]